MAQMLQASPASWLMAAKAKTFANHDLFSYISYTGSGRTFVLTFSCQQYDTTLVQRCSQWLSDTGRTLVMGNVWQVTWCYRTLMQLSAPIVKPGALVSMQTL